MLFMIYFSYFIILYAITENWRYMVISLVIFLIINYLLRKQHIIKIIFWSFILVSLAWIFYQYRNPYGEYEKTFIGQGSITNNLRENQYEFQTSDKTYLLYGKNLHELWDTIRLVAKQSKPKQQTWFFEFNYAKWLHMKGYQWALYEENSTPTISTNQLPWQTKIKSFVQNKVQETYGKNSYAWLLLGMIIWDISLLSKVEYQQFIDSGLVHMLVVSGWNILLVIVFLNAILFFIPLYPRTIIIILWIIAYALVCWMDSSILRAVIMWVISLISIFPGRLVNKRRMLGITYIIMLLINPYYLVYDLGFLLSFSAILGLTIWWEIQEQKNNKNKEKPVNKIQKTRRKFYTSYLLPNIFVSIAIFPVIIFFMWKINLLSIWANILVIPIIPIILLYWVGSCVIFSFREISFLPRIWKIFIDWIFQVNSLFSKRWIYLFVDEQRIKILLFLWMIFFLFRWFKKQFVQYSSTRDRTGK